MNQKILQEELLSAWITLNSKLKDSQMTQSLTYNEAIVMKIVYDQYRSDGVGKTGVQQLVKNTNFLKSLMNRTVNSLCTQGYLKKEREGRNLYVYPILEKLPDFMKVHEHSLDLVQQVINIVGEEDAEHFIRISKKIATVNLSI